MLDIPGQLILNRFNESYKGVFTCSHKVTSLYTRPHFLSCVVKVCLCPLSVHLYTFLRPE